jgi:hypothetical protein
MQYFHKIALFVVVSFGLVMSSCNETKQEGLSPDMITNPNTANGKVDKSVLPRMEFEKTEHNFGKIVDGVKISYTFKFKNTGGDNLVVSKVQTTCGCTSSFFTKEPIPPGGEGRVKLTFDSSNRPGPNHKQATVIANTQPTTQVLNITAMVVKPNEF